MRKYRFDDASMTEMKAWNDFSSASNPPYPRDGDEHEFNATATIRPGDREGQYIVAHNMGFLALWESQMQPIADTFADGAKKVMVRWVKDGRKTVCVVVTSK